MYDKIMPCGHSDLMHRLTIALTPACDVAANRDSVVRGIAIERSRIGDGSFIEAATVTPGVRDLTQGEAMARGLDRLAAAIRGSLGD